MHRVVLDCNPASQICPIFNIIVTVLVYHGLRMGQNALRSYIDLKNSYNPIE